MLTRRFRTGTPRYPLPIASEILWRRAGDELVARFELPPLERDLLIVPSLSVIGGERPWCASWHLRDGDDRRWWLDSVPAADQDAGRDRERGAASRTGPSVDTHIDCFVTRADIEVSFLELRLRGSRVPRESLIVIAARPCRIEAPDAGSMVAAPLPVRAISQMQAPAPVRHHICSPVCLSMVMGFAPTQAYEFAQACYEPRRGMFGIWPHNIRAANAHGYTSAIETFHSLDEAAPLLAAGHVIIASIRYAEGELTGAATPATRGHLVVLRGLLEDRVLVMDPAAESCEQVERSYDRHEFARAWLGTRGVGYLLTKSCFSPNQPT